MAVPLRKAAGGYEPYTRPRQPANKQENKTRATSPKPKRLVRRQVRSHAIYRRTLAWLFLGMSTVLFMMGFSYTFIKADISKVNYNINALQRENDEILLENDIIRGEIAELHSLERIEEKAARELGMIKNVKAEYMMLSNTAVAEGKIRDDKNEADEGQKSVKRLDAVLDFLLAWVNR